MVWRQETYPSPLRYKIVVQVSTSDRLETNHYEAEYAADAGATDDTRVRVGSISDEERANPHVPKGIDIYVQTRRVGPAETATDILGVPILSPLYSFGLSAEAEKSEMEPPPSTVPFPTIVTVSSRGLAYGIILLEKVPYALGSLYHLKLTPLHDPKRYRLRELWIDTATFHTVKARVFGNFTSAPSTNVSWTISFKDIDGVTYVDKEHADAPLDLGRNKLYERASVAFENLEVERDKSLRFLLPPQSYDDMLQEPEFSTATR